MRKVGIKQITEIRKKHNVDILKRMNAGENLKAFDSQASWFPPRPVIEKDPKAIAKLYDCDEANDLVLIGAALSEPKDSDHSEQGDPLPMSS